MLRLGGPESLENLTLGSPKRSSTPKRRLIRLGVRVLSRNRNDQFWPFSSELFQPKHTISKQNHKTNLNQPKTLVLKS